MKSKQLANVLIKMLGFSVCLYAIPSFVSRIVIAVTQWGTPAVAALGVGAYIVGYGVQVVIGIAIIAKSQKIAGWMFKGEDE